MNIHPETSCYLPPLVDMRSGIWIAAVAAVLGPGPGHDGGGAAGPGPDHDPDQDTADPGHVPGDVDHHQGHVGGG